MGADNQLTDKTIARTKRYFSAFTVLLPVVIGVGVVALMLMHEAHGHNWGKVFAAVKFDWRTVSCIILAFLCMFGRDFGLTWRFRELTDKQIKWWQAWRIDMLCEFTSCVTPSAVGGSSLGMVYLNVEGVEFGRATTLMMTTLLMDELFFVIACPIIVLFTPVKELFASGSFSFTHGLEFTFWIVYTAVALWTALLLFGIILRPQWIKSLIGRIFQWRILRRWSAGATRLSENMIATSVRLKEKSIWFWLKIFLGTCLSWLSRMLVVNVLFFGFVPTADSEQWLILAREFIIWLVLMISPTPGGAGLSEWLFSEYYGDLISVAGMGLLLAILWRLVSYYLYLLIGAIIFPGWVKAAIKKVSSRPL